MNLKTSKVTIIRKEHYSVAHLGTQSWDGRVIEVSAQTVDEWEKKKRKEMDRTQKTDTIILDRTF